MSLFSKMASFEDDIDFRPLWKVGYVLSALLMLISIGSLVTRGLNLGIDFEGGTSWQVPAPDVGVDEVRDALRPIGQDGARIQTVGDDVIRVQAEPTDAEGLEEVTDALAEVAGQPPDEVAVSTIGPTWGDEISEKAQRALVIFFILISIYMSVRLEWKMAVGAIAAVVHDIVISVGVYSVFQFEVTPATVIAFLTILGYSMYDTIVVFDKLSENAERPSVANRMSYTDLVNLSLNQTLMRSLNTTITSVLPILSMLVVGSLMLGATTLEEFAIALLVGLTAGAYSSIFIAAPVVAWLKEREPARRQHRLRLEAQGGRRPAEPLVRDKTTVAPSAGAPDPSAGGAKGQAALSGRPIPPRPRKKGRRR